MTPLTSPTPDDKSQAHERRASVRHPRKLEMLWQLLGVQAPELGQAAVFDLSTSGVGLIMGHDFAVGSALLLRLPTSTLGWNTHLVRVKHSERQDDGRYQVGCRFARPLTADQLRALLS